MKEVCKGLVKGTLGHLSSGNVDPSLICPPLTKWRNIRRIPILKLSNKGAY